jgi:hypothetical protein
MATCWRLGGWFERGGAGGWVDGLNGVVLGSGEGLTRWFRGCWLWPRIVELSLTEIRSGLTRSLGPMKP